MDSEHKVPTYQLAITIWWSSSGTYSRAKPDHPATHSINCPRPESPPKPNHLTVLLLDINMLQIGANRGFKWDTHPKQGKNQGNQCWWLDWSKKGALSGDEKRRVQMSNIWTGQVLFNPSFLREIHKWVSQSNRLPESEKSLWPMGLGVMWRGWQKRRLFPAESVCKTLCQTTQQAHVSRLCWQILVSLCCFRRPHFCPSPRATPGGIPR